MNQSSCHTNTATSGLEEEAEENLDDDVKRFCLEQPSESEQVKRRQVRQQQQREWIQTWRKVWIEPSWTKKCKSIFSDQRENYYVVVIWGMRTSLKKVEKWVDGFYTQMQIQVRDLVTR